jgi:hypothetical protein
VFDLIERLYAMDLYQYDSCEYTNHIKLAKQFKTELDAITLAKEAQLTCFRVDKIYVLEY